MFDLFIDPGLHHSGVAISYNNELCWPPLVTDVRTSDPGESAVEQVSLIDDYVRLVTSKVWRDCTIYKMSYIHRRVCERMQSRGKFSPVDVEDLLTLNLISGHLGNEWVTPRQWKGGLSRTVEQNRTRKALSPKELAMMPVLKSKSDINHNAWSAVGILLHCTGRTKLR